MNTLATAATLALLALSSCAAAAPSYAARGFASDRVQLARGSFLEAKRDRNLMWLMSLNNSRLLCTHTKPAGIDPTCEEYSHPGYYEHFLGHYLSASALLSSNIRHAELARKSAELISVLRKVQEVWTSRGEPGYLFAHDPSLLYQVEKIGLDANDPGCYGYWGGRPVWVPFYNVHKTMAGLIDQYQLLGNKEALVVATALGDWIANHVDGFVAAHGVVGWQKVLCEEWGGINDAMYRLYEITHDAAHLRTANAFEKYHITLQLAAGVDPLDTQHANTHIPQMIGAAQGYETTGNETKRLIAENFFHFVTTAHSFSTGGSNAWEHWHTAHHVASELSDQTEESCTQYNMLKLARKFFLWTANASYADFYERAIINGQWGNEHETSHQFIYMMPMAASSHKPWGVTPNNDLFPCCWGTLSETFSKLADSIYFQSLDASTLFVNQFVASNVDWSEAAVSLSQETTFPVTSNTKITVTATKAVKKWTLALRVPAWATSGKNTISINGKVFSRDAKPGSYALITRQWEAGDVVEADFPMSLAVSHIDDVDTKFANLYSIMYGPVVLVGITSDNMVKVSPSDVGKWLKRSSQTELIWSGEQSGKSTTFIPLFRVMDDVYTTYFFMNA